MAKRSLVHLVARIERPDVNLCDAQVGPWLWSRLRAAFPDAYGCGLMPDHPHLVAPMADPAAGRTRLNRLLGQLARRLGLPRVGRASEPSIIADRDKLLRHLRYVALNPTRAGLTDDPLRWTFSSHRDVLGATASPWVPATRVARALGRPIDGFAAWFHRYVSADPSVAVDGTPPPQPAAPRGLPRYPLSRIAAAAAACLRESIGAIRERGSARVTFIGLALEQGWRHWPALAHACGTTECSVRRAAGRVDPVALAAARLCLADDRLLLHPAPAMVSPPPNTPQRSLRAR